MELGWKIRFKAFNLVIAGLAVFYAGNAVGAEIAGTHARGNEIFVGDQLTGVTVTIPSGAPQPADQFLRPFLSRLTDPRAPVDLALTLSGVIDTVRLNNPSFTVTDLERAFRGPIQRAFANVNPPLSADQLNQLVSGIAIIRAAGGPSSTQTLLEGILRAATPSPSPVAGNQQQPRPSASPAAGNQNQPRPSVNPQANNNNGAQPSPTPSARERELERALQQRALEDAARQAAAEQAAQQAAQDAKNGKGGGGDKGGGGGGGGGKGGGEGSGNDSGKPEAKGLDEALKHLNQGKNKEPSLSELRNSLGGDQEKGRGAKDEEKKKDENKFNLGSSKASVDKDLFKNNKKDLDGKKADATAADIQDPSQGGALNPKPNIKSAILTGPTSLPQAIADQYGRPSNATVDASFGGGDGGGSSGSGFGGATVSGGPAGGGGAGGSLNFNSVGQAEPYTMDPPIKKILQEVQSVNADSAGEGSEGEGSSSENSDYTSKSAVKSGSGLFVNQILLTSGNQRAKGRGIMAYVGNTREFCQGPQGKQMALCELRKKSQGEVSAR